MTLLKVSDNYSASIVGNFTSSASVITVDTAPVKTSGFLTIFDLNGNQLEKIYYSGVSTLNLTGCIRGLSFDDNSLTPVVGNAKDLKNGMAISMTVSQHYINPIIDVVNGTTASGGVMKNPATRTISDSRHLVDKEYADAISASGIVSMLVSGGGGTTINVNSGTYILNGSIYFYAGATAQALTDDATNYVQIKDGVLDIPTDAFDDDAIPLAVAVCSGGDITSLTDSRPFYTGTDIRQNSSAYMTGGTLATSVVATWTAVNNGSFRVVVDGIAYNVDGIDFSSGITTMDDVAAKIQVALRAATGGSETVVWSTNKFIITSGTTGSTSGVSVLATSTGTVGTDISGLGATAFMDSETGRGTATAGLWSGLGRDANGIYIDLAANPGLEIVGGKLKVKVKSGGGILIGSNGLEADTTIIPTTQTMPAYEDLVAGDLLKTINDSGTYKLKKITGIQANGGTFTSGSSSMAFMSKGIQISSDKIAVLYLSSYNLYLRTFTISGSTITDDNNSVFVGLGTDVDQGTFRYEIKKVADNKFIVVYDKAHTNIYGRVFSVSGTTITPGTETIIESTDSGRANNTTIEEIETNKFLVASTILTSDSTSYVKARIIYTSSSDNSITPGNVINAYSDNSYNFLFKLKLVKVNTDTFILCGKRYTGSNHYFSAMVINISGVNLTGGGYSDQLLTDSDLIYDCYLYDTDKVFAILNYGASNNYKKVIFLTRNSNTITNTSFNTTIECGIANQSFTIKKLGSFYYANSYTKTTKFLVDTVFGTKILKEYTTSDNKGLLVNYDNKAITLNGSTYSSIYTNYLFLYLLDHDEFVTSANDSYTAGDSVPLTDRFTGFSSLLNGIDYYINSTGDGLTVDSTYQKVGKAINDTTILKG